MRREKILADAEEKRVAAMAIEVGQRQRDCEEDLVRAEPALVAAQEALNTLNKANLTELKSFGTPPLAVTNVTAAVLVLLSPQGSFLHLLACSAHHSIITAQIPFIYRMV